MCIFAKAKKKKNKNSSSSKGSIVTVRMHFSEKKDRFRKRDFNFPKPRPLSMFERTHISDRQQSSLSGIGDHFTICGRRGSFDSILLRGDGGSGSDAIS